jgi:hypothetical protein
MGPFLGDFGYPLPYPSPGQSSRLSNTFPITQARPKIRATLMAQSVIHMMCSKGMS